MVQTYWTCDCQRRRVGWEKWIMGARRYELAIIRYVSPRDGMYSVVIVVNNILLHI